MALALTIVSIQTHSCPVSARVLFDGQHFFGSIDGRNVTGRCSAEEIRDWVNERIRSAVDIAETSGPICRDEVLA